MKDITITFTEAELGDLVDAVHDAQAELCTGDNFPDATAFYDRLNDLIYKLEGYFQS